MGALYITSGRDEVSEGLPDQGKDVLKTDALNALPGPLLARLLGGDEYEIIDIEPQIAMARINVCGLSQVIDFIEITKLTDLEGVEHNPDTFWHDYIEDEEQADLGSRSGVSASSDDTAETGAATPSPKV